ncbi:MAG: glycosyltransferase family 39 protein [Bacteroidia bacterium]|nr:glycosyltransferase family 39 protein [Bacteroidia bacterium]
MGAVDGEGYAKLADTLLSCGKFAFGCEAHSTVFRGPGYPGFLALINLPFGQVSYEWTVIVQILLNAGSAALLFSLVFNEKGLRAANTALLVFLSVPVLHVFVPRFHLENVLLFFLLAVVALLVRRSEYNPMWSTIAAAVLLGLGILVKQTFLLLPIILASVVWRVARQPRLALVLLLLPYGVVLPWSVRSSALAQSLLPVHTNAGFNMLIGNETVKKFPEAPFTGSVLWDYGYAAVRKSGSDSEPRTATQEYEEDARLLDIGLRQLCEEPIILVKILINPILFFTLGSTLLNSIVLGVPALILVFFSARGVWAGHLSAFLSILCGVITVYYLFVHIPLYAIGRFSIPVLPLMIVLAMGYRQKMQILE